MQTNRIDPPQKTFFFERHDGSIISVGEQEAWRIINGRNQTYIQKAKPVLIGVSDGMLFYKAVQESHALLPTDPDAAIARLRLGHQEELDYARGKIEMPRNFDVIDKNGQPTKM